jgi:hypothetical protein
LEYRLQPETDGAFLHAQLAKNDTRETGADFGAAQKKDLHNFFPHLGGHLGRAGDAPPGSEVLWRGMTRLADISEAYRLYH